jgi:hypothetical protein
MWTSFAHWEKRDCLQNIRMAYAASAAGLKRGGSSEAAFLLLRAQALPDDDFVRRSVCAATAAELARRARDLPLLEEAVDFLRGELATDGPPITLESRVLTAAASGASL